MTIIPRIFQRRVERGVMRIDFNDLEAVKQLASKLGGTVTKWPDRQNYNIAADRRKAESDERAGRCVIIR